MPTNPPPSPLSLTSAQPSPSPRPLSPAQPPKPHTFPLTRTHQRPNVQRLRIHTTPSAPSGSMAKAKSSKPNGSTTYISEAYTPSPAKLAWQNKMQARAAMGGVPGVGLSPACFREQSAKAGSSVQYAEMILKAAAIDDGDDQSGCFDFEELRRRAKTLRGQYGNEHMLQEHSEAGSRPRALPRWHTYAAGERILHINSIDEDNLSKAVASSTTNTTQPTTASSSPSSKGWWDVLKSPFFNVTPVSGGSGGSASQISSPESPASALQSASLAASRPLPVRLPPPVPTRVPVPASVDVNDHKLRLPAFVAIVMEANRLESERRAADGIGLQTISPLLGAAVNHSAVTNPSASSTTKQEVPMRDYFSPRPPIRPTLPRGIHSLPARLGKAIAPVAAANAARPRNAIASTSFVQAVLDMDAQEKNEKRMKVKRKKMKTFEEEEEDWEFKCCGIDESFADCVDTKEQKIEAQAVSSIKTTVEPRRRPTVKELRSGSNGVMAVERQGDGGIRGGSERRRKLVRWWTSLS